MFSNVHLAEFLTGAGLLDNFDVVSFSMYSPSLIGAMSVNKEDWTSDDWEAYGCELEAQEEMHSDDEEYEVSSV